MNMLMLLFVTIAQGMRHVASQKLVMNERQASSRTAAAAAGKDGHILLGGAAVPEAVLRGKGLRALLDAQQQAAGHVPVGGLIDGECAARAQVRMRVTLVCGCTALAAAAHCAERNHLSSAGSAAVLSFVEMLYTAWSACCTKQLCRAPASAAVGSSSQSNQHTATNRWYATTTASPS
jgi:hypothetical protein